MRHFIPLGVVAAAFALSLPSAASAAQQGGIPPGSYQDTCKDRSLNGDTLNAQCKSNAGRWHATALHNFERCVGDIINVDGNLRCQKGGPPPSGTYMQTCKDIRVHINTVSARCAGADGRWVDTSLNEFSRCAIGIANAGGQLQCARDAARDGDRDRDRDRERDGYRDRPPDRDQGWLPRGSYPQTCRNIHVRGDVLLAQCQATDGRWVEAVLDDFDQCTGEIVNDNGDLHCTKKAGWVIPAGPYTESCRDIHLHGDVLAARCETRDGRWVWSTLNDWDTCAGEVVNVDGQLLCNRDRDRDRE
ncbi:MAG TPA: CVNH domain-containing protein [Candidatus Acidoferrales bacterium]|nr:CVNH domain-containing protein [Candidatus Acidoferrales bacterium]